VVVLGTFIFPARSIRVIRRKGKRRRSRSFWLFLLVIVGIATFYVGVEKIRDPLAGDTGLLLMALGVLVTVIAIPATVALTVKGLCAALARFKWFSPLSTVVLTAAGRYSMQVSRWGVARMLDSFRWKDLRHEFDIEAEVQCPVQGRGGTACCPVGSADC